MNRRGQTNTLLDKIKKTKIPVEYFAPEDIDYIIHCMVQIFTRCVVKKW
jgi:hypothetical protein